MAYRNANDPKTVRIKSDAHPSGYIIVNEDDQRAKSTVPEGVAEDATSKRRGRPRKYD